MMNNNPTAYTSTIPVGLAKELKIAGFPIRKIIEYNGEPYWDELDEDEPGWCDCDRYELPTYARVFDWFSNLGYNIDIYHDLVFNEEGDAYISDDWSYLVDNTEYETGRSVVDCIPTPNMTWGEVSVLCFRKVLEHMAKN